MDLVSISVDAADMDMPTPMEAALGAAAGMVDVVGPIALAGGFKGWIESKESISVIPGPYGLSRDASLTEVEE